MNMLIKVELQPFSESFDKTKFSVDLHLTKSEKSPEQSKLRVCIIRIFYFFDVKGIGHIYWDFTGSFKSR